jgi:peptidoglycan/xylan/chitin deacetylase (PgdA/CDA1 family)
MAWAVRGRSSTVFGPSVYRGPRTRRVVALTFDDGPSESTPALLEILGRHHAHATFFQCGSNVERLPEIARAVLAAGHEIGNHGYAHPLYALKSPRFVEEDVIRGQEAVRRVTGVNARLFRAPFGVRWFGLRAIQRRLDLLGVMWTGIGYDWSRTAAEVVSRLRRQAANGAILCLHDGRMLAERPDIGVTLEAVERLVPVLLDQGYELETVTQLLCPTS